MSEEPGFEREENEVSAPPSRLPQNGVDVGERKRRIIQSRKDATKMWAPILEGFRAYGATLHYVHVIEDLGR